MVGEQRDQYPAEWAATSAVAPKLGMSKETQGRSLRRAERDAGARPGLTTLDRQRLEKLERETKERRRSNEILRKASASFAPVGARPPQSVMYAFIDAHRAAVGVAPICDVLAIAPSACYAHRAAIADPVRCSAQVPRDDSLCIRIQTCWATEHGVYRAKKVLKELRPQGVAVARCTVERLMRRLGLEGVVRGRASRTTIPAHAARRPRTSRGETPRQRRRSGSRAPTSGTSRRGAAS